MTVGATANFSVGNGSGTPHQELLMFTRRMGATKNC